MIVFRFLLLGGSQPSPWLFSFSVAILAQEAGVCVCVDSVLRVRCDARMILHAIFTVPICLRILTYGGEDVLPFNCESFGLFSVHLCESGSAFDLLVGFLTLRLLD